MLENQIINMIRFFKLTGRINRSELLVITLILFLLEGFLWLVLIHKSTGFILISTIIFIVYLIQCSKRYHDLNRWGVNGFVWFILPIANIYYFYQLYLKKGISGINKYGKPSSFSLSNLSINTKTTMESQNNKDENKTSVTNESVLNEDNKLTETFEFKLKYSKIIKDIEVENVNNTSIYGWLKKDGDWIEKGKPLVIVEYLYNETLSNKTCLIFSEKSGFVESCIKDKEYFQDGDIVYKLHPITSYENENSPSKKSFYFYFDKYAYNEFSQSYFNRSFCIKEWLKQDGEFVNQGEIILILAEGSYLFENGDIYNHVAEKSGFLDIVNYYKSYLNQNNLVYIIHENDANRINRKFINTADTKLDDFTNKKIIKWKQVGNNNGYSEGITSISNDNKITFTFTFNNLDDNDFIVFQFYSKEMMLSKGDVISFLFTDNRIIDFPINGVSYKATHPHIEKLFENKVQITLNELHHFEDIEFLKWKITLKKQNREIIGGENGTGQYESHKNLVTVIQKLTKEYREIVSSEIANYKPLLERETLTLSTEMPVAEECHVYLMTDTINHYHKIGISNKPSWREKTLQSEKPTIELLASKRFINRKIAASFEKALHETYAQKRIRGEWFNLDVYEINEIIKTLND